MQGSKDAAEVRGSFQETASRKTAEHAVKHRDGGVGSVVANHRGGGESLVVVTTLYVCVLCMFHTVSRCWRSMLRRLTGPIHGFSRFMRTFIKQSSPSFRRRNTPRLCTSTGQ